jgi:hypothetical protein
MVMYDTTYKKIFFAFTLLYCTMPMLHAMEKSNSNKASTALHFAAKEGSIEKMKTALDQGADINSTKCDFNNTPLHIATWFGHKHCVKFLIDRGAKPDITNDHGSTPMHTAAWKNESACLQELIKHGIHVGTRNTTGIGNTELYLAAKAGSTQCLQILLEHNNTKEYIDLECSGNNSTAIQAAAFRQHAQCYWNLVITGADYTKKISDEKILKNVSEMIDSNAPLKKFLQIIERNGKNNSPRFNGIYDFCGLCNQDYQHNNVVVTIKPCLQTFHADCFENYCVDFFIKNNKNNASLTDLKKDKSDKELAHCIKTHPIGSIDLATKCPSCKSNFDPQQEIELSVFLQ